MQTCTFLYASNTLAGRRLQGSEMAREDVKMMRSGKSS
jgi:hypothetical protein